MGAEGSRILLFHPDSTRQLRPAPGPGTAPHALAPSLTGRGDPIQSPARPLTRDLDDPPPPPHCTGSCGSECPSCLQSAGGGEGFLCLLPRSPALPQARARKMETLGGSHEVFYAPHQAGASPYSLQWAKTGRTCPMAPLGPASVPPPTPAAPPWAWGHGRSSPPRPRRRRHPPGLLQQPLPPPPPLPPPSAPLGAGGRGRGGAGTAALGPGAGPRLKAGLDAWRAGPPL